jgi:hypothetical protein
MNLIKRLGQWYRDRRAERQALKGQKVDEPNRTQGATPIVGIAEDFRLRMLLKRGRH